MTSQFQLEDAILYNNMLIGKVTKDIEDYGNKEKMGICTLLIMEKRIALINSLKKQNSIFKKKMDEDEDEKKKEEEPPKKDKKKR